MIANTLIARTTREAHYKDFGYLGAVICGLLLYINYHKYVGKYNNLRFKWKDEDPKKRSLKGVLVIISLILPPIIFTIVSNHTH